MFLEFSTDFFFMLYRLYLQGAVAVSRFEGVVVFKNRHPIYTHDFRYVIMDNTSKVSTRLVLNILVLNLVVLYNEVYTMTDPYRVKRRVQ